MLSASSRHTSRKRPHARIDDELSDCADNRGDRHHGARAVVSRADYADGGSFRHTLRNIDVVFMVSATDRKPAEHPSGDVLSSWHLHGRYRVDHHDGAVIDRGDTSHELVLAAGKP